MPYIEEFLPVIIDPGHERFAQTGKLYIEQSRYDDLGELTIKFSDGVVSRVNSGLRYGLVQYYIFPHNQSSQADHLISVLPQIKDQLSTIFRRAALPQPEEHQEEIQTAHAAATFLIAATLYPETYSNRSVGFVAPSELL